MSSSGEKKDGAGAAQAVRLYILCFVAIAGVLLFFSFSTTRALHCILDPARSKARLSLVQTR